MKRVFLCAALLLCGALVGGILGARSHSAYLNHKEHRIWARLSPDEAAHLKQTRQYFYSLTALAESTTFESSPSRPIRERLEEERTKLDGLKRNSPAEVRPALAVYSMFADIRLARLHLKQGDDAGANRLREEAMAECAIADWKDCSLPSIEAATESWVRSSVPKNAEPAGDYE